MSLKPVIKLYGERNTGTNYLRQLLVQNIDVNLLENTSPSWIRLIQFLLPGREWLIDLYFKHTFSKNLGWKHRNLCLEDYNGMNLEKVFFITLTKNPYSWLLSLYKNPYHQYYAEKITFEDFLIMPWKTVRRENAPNIICNPIKLWNIKNKSYILFKKKFNVINLKYESLIKNPDFILKKITRNFNLKRKNDFKNITLSTKNDKKSYRYYKNYYLGKKWKKKYSKKNINLINKYIDENVLDFFGYKKEF